MTMHKIDITAPHPDSGYGARVCVDDRDLSRGITSYKVEQDGSGVPVVTLALRRAEDMRLCSPRAVVVLDDATREFLVDAGWTPPALAGEEVAR